MDTDWIVDVLGDLRTFAQKNNMPQLASSLEDTLEVASAELSERTKEPRLRVVNGDGATQRTLYRKA